ncbi:MAG: hypothetical protein ACR2MX_03705 [Cyclobacteriaceae bacterium]
MIGSLTVLSDDISHMSVKEHFWYWVFPISLLGLLMFFFFSKIPLLVELVNPKMNREWGLLENIQLVIIAVMIGLSIYALRRKKHVLQKWGFGLIAVFAVFILLEEIDYAAHFREYLTGSKESYLDELVGTKNIHNYAPNTAKIFKRSVYVLMLIIFIVAPLFKTTSKSNIISYLIPEPKIVITAVLTILVEIIARLLVPLTDLKLVDLTMDIGEFSEIMVYYLFLIYLIQLVFNKQWPLNASLNGDS